MRGSAKNKIFFYLFVWVVLCSGMFFWVFKNMTVSNQASLDETMTLKKEEALLEAQKQSFIQAKNDLAKLKSYEIQPEDFFSKDVTLVNEIRRLEAVSQTLSLNTTFSGISGTLKTAVKAPTKSSIVKIPFNINTKGTLANTVAFMEYLENLEFMTSVNLASVSSAGEGEVNASFSAAFYLKK